MWPLALARSSLEVVLKNQLNTKVGEEFNVLLGIDMARGAVMHALVELVELVDKECPGYPVAEAVWAIVNDHLVVLQHKVAEK